MAKLVKYTCDKCGFDFEEIFLSDLEETPNIFGPCEKCKKGQLLKNNRKDNCQVDKCFTGYCS